MPHSTEAGLLFRKSLHSADRNHGGKGLMTKCEMMPGAVVELLGS